MFKIDEFGFTLSSRLPKGQAVLLTKVKRGENIAIGAFVVRQKCVCVFIQGVSGGIVNILGGGSMDYSE